MVAWCKEGAGATGERGLREAAPMAAAGGGCLHWQIGYCRAVPGGLASTNALARSRRVRTMSCNGAVALSQSWTCVREVWWRCLIYDRIASTCKCGQRESGGEWGPWGWDSKCPAGSALLLLSTARPLLLTIPARKSHSTCVSKRQSLSLSQRICIPEVSRIRLQEQLRRRISDTQRSVQ